MLITPITQHLCASKYQPGFAFVLAPNGHVFNVRVGCVHCGRPTDVQPQDVVHGHQTVELDGPRLVRLEPGFTCSYCGVRQAVQRGSLGRV